MSLNWCGIHLYCSSDNRIHYNNITGNEYNNAYDSYRTNTWNSATAGNYYSDYTGTDSDDDGIGAAPHPLPGGSSIDYFPLMQLWEGDVPQERGDLDHDGHIAPQSRFVLQSTAASATLAAADVSGDGRVISLYASH